MRETDVQTVLVVRAFEEEDRDGRLLGAAERTAATGRATADCAGEGDRVRQRARLLFERLVRDWPALPRWLSLARLSPGPAPVLAGIAVALGLLTNALGPERRINLLSLPLLGLLAWNLVIYAGAAVLGLRRGTPSRGLAGRLSTALVERLGRRRLRRAGGGDGALAATALARFAALWRERAGALLATRVQVALHVAAMAFAAGAVGGSYLRGLIFEYRVTWESTFLGATTVQTLLDAVLGPAAALLGIEVPDVAPLRGPAQSGDAAPWIHLYATTIALVVFLPRCVLAAVQQLRAQRGARRLALPLDDGYFRRILAGGRGEATVVHVLPYSYAPERGTLERLRSLLHDFFGTRADVRVATPLGYGEEPDGDLPGASGEAGERCLLVLFSAAQPPEAEVHGTLLTRLGSCLESDARLLALVDPAPYRRGVDHRERLRERIGAWQRVAREAGATVVALQFDPVGHDDLLEALGSAYRSAAATGGA